MPRLVFRAAARRDLEEIAAYIERESGFASVADAFIDKLTDYCEHLARLPGMMGRARPEFGRDRRSVTYGSYVIVIRYDDQDGPRSHLHVIRVIHGRRDVDAFFPAKDEGSES